MISLFRLKPKEKHCLLVIKSISTKIKEKPIEKEGISKKKQEKLKNLTEKSSKHMLKVSYDYEKYNKKISYIFISPLIISYSLLGISLFIYDFSYFISNSYIIKNILYSNCIFNAFILSKNMVKSGDDLENADGNKQKEVFENENRYGKLILPLIFIVLYSNYVIYQRRLNIKDSLFISFLNLLNFSMKFNIFGLKEVKSLGFTGKGSGIGLVFASVLMVVLSSMMVKSKGVVVESNVNEVGLVNIRSFNDVILEDDKKLVEENEVFVGLYK